MSESKDGDPGIVFGDQGAGTAAWVQSNNNSNPELFPGFLQFFAKVALENSRRRADKKLLSITDLESFCGHIGIHSISSLFLLAVSEPDGVKSAFLAASAPCECFESMSVMDRKVFLQIILDHQIASVVASVPPNGVGMVGTASPYRMPFGTLRSVPAGTAGGNSVESFP